MDNIKEEIEKIIQEGIDKNLSVDDIVEKILAIGNQMRKREHIPIQEYERMVKESKEKLERVRNTLQRSLTGTYE